MEDREVRQVVCEELCVAKCHAKRRWMSPSATPATQNEGGCHQPATQSGAAPRAPSAPKRATRASPVPQVPRLPRETTVDVTGCHQVPTPATQSGTAPRATQRAQARHQSQPSAPSATPATRNEGGCHQATPTM